MPSLPTAMPFSGYHNQHHPVLRQEWHKGYYPLQYQPKFQCCAAKSGRAYRGIYHPDGLQPAPGETSALDAPAFGRETRVELDVPVVCMDEKQYHLLGEDREPLPTHPRDTHALSPLCTNRFEIEFYFPLHIK